MGRKTALTSFIPTITQAFLNPISIPQSASQDLDNPLGLCSHQGCKQLGIVETPQHLLLDCPSFHPLRERLVSLCLRLRHPISYRIVVSYLFQQPSKLLSLILDCSTIPEVIISAQTYGNDIFNDIFYLGRTWCFAIHRERLKMLGRWNIN